MKLRPDFITIGAVTRVHGVRGEVIVSPITDDVQQFFRFQKIYLYSSSNGRRKTVDIECVKRKKNLLIIKFKNIDDRNQAQELKGALVEKQFDDAEALADDEYYVFDLIGLTVKTVDDHIVGKLRDVLSLPANDVYVVFDEQNREYLIPAIKDIIKSIDLERQEIIIDPIEGLL